VTFSVRRHGDGLVIRWQHPNPDPALSGELVLRGEETQRGDHKPLIDALRRNGYGETQ
jgi:hypothetical protein